MGIIMKIKNLQGIICLVIFILFTNPVSAENRLNTDSYFDIVIAVTVNGNDNIMGKLEYSYYKLQLVTFTVIGGVVHTEPFVFEILEEKVLSKNVHKIKCRDVNDKFAWTEISGTIDFHDENHPKINLVNDAGFTYISNISKKSKTTARKYIPNVWLGQ
jgi:hypothetical protein